MAAAVARTRSKKKAAEAAQQLWHEWAEENLAAMAPRAQRERLPQDTKHLLTTTGGSSKLVQEAERMKAMADARLKQCASFWEETPKQRKTSRMKVKAEAQAKIRGVVESQMTHENLRAQLAAAKEEAASTKAAAAQREAALRQQLSMVEERRRQAEARVAVEVEGKEELHHTLALLQHKTMVANERDMEQQRKLKVFGQLEPLFARLQEQFAFGSPDDIIRRFNPNPNPSPSPSPWVRRMTSLTGTTLTLP